MRLLFKNYWVKGRILFIPLLALEFTAYKMEIMVFGFGFGMFRV